MKATGIGGDGETRERTPSRQRHAWRSMDGKAPPCARCVCARLKKTVTRPHGSKLGLVVWLWHASSLSGLEESVGLNCRFVRGPLLSFLSAAHDLTPN
jgi:hypothetical protein